MTDDIDIRDDEGLSPTDDEASASELAEAEEALAAAEEAFETEEDLLGGEDAELQIQEALAEAHRASLFARARWSIVHKELLILLFANCLFFAGALAAWSRSLPFYAQAEPALSGLDTIRGAMIFALAILGFFLFALNMAYRQLKIWPYLVNAVLALWVGIPGFTSGIGSTHWEEAGAFLETKSSTLLEQILTPLSTIPPGHWLLTMGGMLVLIVLLRGIISGASASKAAAASGEGRRRRR